MLNEEILLTLLHSLTDSNFQNELDFTQKIVPQFVALLGYGEAETFYDVKMEWNRLDVVLASSITSRPWIIIEVKKDRPKNIGEWAYQLKRYLIASGSPIGVVLSTDLLLLVVDGEEKRFDLRSINMEQVREIFQILARFVQKPSIDDITSVHGKLVELIESVENASNNEKKGKALENLAQLLFDTVPSLKCKYKNLQTRSSEIDLVIEYDRSKGQIALFEELGRYCLIECKNWSKPVGVVPVRDFMGKLDKCKTRLGIIFAKNGVTGVDSGADALREIQSRFDRDGVYLLVFSLQDLKSIKSGQDFEIAIDLKADNLRFDS
jgi:Restriction endonuclease